MKVKVNQLLQVCPDDLIGIDKNDLIEAHGEKNIEKENLICPDDALLFSLWPQPCRPFIGDKLILEAVFLSELRYKFLKKTFNGAATTQLNK